MPNTSIEQLQNMISELILSQKENENLCKESANRFKETEKILAHKYSETWAMFKETNAM